MTSNFCTEFGQPSDNLTTKEGRQMIEQAKDKFNVRKNNVYYRVYNEYYRGLWSKRG